MIDEMMSNRPRFRASAAVLVPAVAVGEVTPGAVVVVPGVVPAVPGVAFGAPACAAAMPSSCTGRRVELAALSGGEGLQAGNLTPVARVARVGLDGDVESRVDSHRSASEVVAQRERHARHHVASLAGPCPFRAAGAPA